MSSFQEQQMDGFDGWLAAVSIFFFACVGFHYPYKERRLYYDGINYVAQKFKSQNEFQQQTTDRTKETTQNANRKTD